MSNYEEVFEYIDTNFDQHIRVVQDHLRQPSVSLINEGVLEYAKMLASSIRELGGELKSHFGIHDFPKLEICLLSAYNWSKTPLTADIIQAQIKALKMFGMEEAIWLFY